MTRPSSLFLIRHLSHRQVNHLPITPPAHRHSPGARPRRVIAWFIDFAPMVVVPVGNGFATYERLVGPLSGVSSEVASGARDLVTSGFDFAGVASRTGAAAWSEISAGIIQGFIALVVIEFLYLFLALRFTGRCPTFASRASSAE